MLHTNPTLIKNKDDDGMDYSILKEINSGRTTGKLSVNQYTIENSSKGWGLASLKKGQLITGTVVTVGEQVTLDFNGQKITALMSVFGNAIPGEEKTFEVVKASMDEIELKLIEDINKNRKPFKAIMEKDTDWESVLAQKEKAAQKEEQKAGREAEYQQTKTQLERIGATLTELDCKKLEEEGFPVETFTVNGLYHALGRIKTELASGQQTKAGLTAAETIDADITAAKAVKDSERKTLVKSEDTNTIAQKLQQTDLPVTAENVSKVMKALDLSESAARIDDKAMRYLIARDALPTAEYIYKASYSGTSQRQEQLSEDAWSELESQVKEVIQSAGYEVNDQNLEDAKWLIENKLPLTVETFTYKKKLEELKASYDKETVLNTMMEGMKEGISPAEVPLLSQSMTDPEQIVADLWAIQPETVSVAVKNGSELSIRNLLDIQSKLNAGTSVAQSDQTAAEVGTADVQKTGITEQDEMRDAKPEDINKADTRGADSDLSETEASDKGDSGRDTSDRQSGEGNLKASYEEVRARRQLEEIRLRMTLEAARTLEKKGIKVETQQLSKVVDALRELEDNYYRQYLKEADVSATADNLQILKDTTSSIERLKYIPSYVLGSTLAESNTQTIPSLLNEGLQLQAKLEKAGTAYETLMTVPNREYGDSIKKAFANMDSLLAEMNIENTEENQRAVRILGYNSMEINQEAINQVKAYDQEVTAMIKNLHPEVTVRMLREGINPLGMSINELNQTIDRIKDEQGITSEEKYSTYLRKLEKADIITAEERKAYIGIYRLLYNVEKSDGAALGAVVKAGQEVTLEHLLTAVQTSKKGRLDAAVNDEFGTLQSLTRAKESIAEQISGFAEGTSRQNGEQDSKDRMAEGQIRYLERILREMKEELSPDTLKEAGQNLSQTAGQTTTTAWTAYSQPSAEQQGIWETVKDVPVEQLAKLLQKVNTGQALEDEVYAQKVQEIRELCRASEQAVRFLNDYQVPTTSANIHLANQILSNGESPIKRFFKLQKENSAEISENSLKEINDLSDTLSDRHSMEEVYTQLETNAKAVLNQSYSEEKIDSFKLAELKSIAQQMTFIKTLAEKEYYQIPIETDRGVTNMNLTILRGTKETGKVSVTIWSEQLGNVKAELSLKDRTLSGIITSDNSRGLEQLQKNDGQLKEAALESDVTLKQLDYGFQRRDKDSYSYLNPDFNEGTTSMKAETERTLYRLAKAIVRMVRSAENSRSEADLEVS